MSHSPATPSPRHSIPDFTAAKGVSKLVLLTAYTAPMAEILSPHCDMLMVGDSLGMVVYGMDSTLPVTLDMMINHGVAVVRKANGTPVVVDLPFGSYQGSKEQAFASAARVMKETGCMCVKLEGGAEMAETIAYLAQRAIPVMAHIGLMPQHLNTVGGFKTQGKDDDAYKAILADAHAVAKAGAFAVVVEGVIEPLAAEITRMIPIPTIGIGASAACDGQVLVVDDMLGMFERVPRFVKKYTNLREQISAAAAQYAAEVRSGAFPTEAQLYGVVNSATKKPARKH